MSIGTYCTKFRELWTLATVYISIFFGVFDNREKVRELLLMQQKLNKITRL